MVFCVLGVVFMTLESKLAEWEHRIALNNSKKQVYPDPRVVVGRDLERNSVTKSNVLARAYYRFNLVEKRVMEALISQINPKFDSVVDLQKLTLRAVDYARIYNVPPKIAYRDLEAAVSALMHRVFSVKGAKGREEFTLMSNAQYLDGQGAITCSFNSYIVKHLIDLRAKFTKYPLKTTASFKSSYSWRFYELLVSWAKDPKFTDGLFAGWCSVGVDELREMLGVPPSYQWINFKNQVIDVAKKELESNLGILVELKYLKTGRKITSIKIIFSEKETLDGLNAEN
jgi:plasmid replication initiation protein